jgi:hypothetical protein
MEAQALSAIATAALPWEERFNEKSAAPCTAKTW